MPRIRFTKALETFLSLCDNTAVKVYGPYPPSKGRKFWRIQIYDPTTQRKKSIQAKTREEAEALKPLVAQQIGDISPLSIHAAIEQYLEHKSTFAKPVSVRTVGDRLRTFLPDIPLSQINPAKAESLYQQETQRIGRFGTKIKPASHHALLRTTKEFFGWLVKRGLASSNPFAGVDPIGMVDAGKAQPRETDAKKLDEVLFNAANNGDEGALALLIQIYLGLRSGEVLALQISAVEREGRKVSIVRGKSKNAKRGLELYSEVAMLLWMHCQGRPQSERVFAANLPQRPANSWMYKRLHRFCELAGIAKYCPHSLRGLHSSLALTSGATTHEVAASLGHASFSTTKRHYADPSALHNTESRRLVAILRGGDGAEAEVQNLSKAERVRLVALLTKDL